MLITFIITGGIAAYKTPSLIRLLKKEGYEARVLVTETAKQFVTIKTLELLSGQKVFENKDWQGFEHIDIAKNTDIFVLAPLTANTIAKLVHGFADSLITSSILASRKPILLVPSMNSGMFNNPIVQKNIQELLKYPKFHLLSPTEGELACGDLGKGRMPEIEEIFWEIKKLVSKPILKGKKVLVSLGATREPIDPVRCVTNYSSGKMGYALAKEAYFLGAEVTVIRGHALSQNLPKQVRIFEAEQTKEMLKKSKELFPKSDIFVSSAAVSDFVPDKKTGEKIKKGKGDITLKLKKNTDILKELSRMKKKKQVLVGFALETNDLLTNAKKKMKEKNLDIIIANSIENFGTDEGEVILLSKKGEKKKIKGSKNKISEVILKFIANS